MTQGFLNELRALMLKYGVYQMEGEFQVNPHNVLQLFSVTVMANMPVNLDLCLVHSGDDITADGGLFLLHQADQPSVTIGGKVDFREPTPINLQPIDPMKTVTTPNGYKFVD